MCNPFINKAFIVISSTGGHIVGGSDTKQQAEDIAVKFHSTSGKEHHVFERLSVSKEVSQYVMESTRDA